MKIEDYSKYYIQGSDHYLIPKDVFKELFNEMVNWKEESIEFSKKYKTQQKEFIKYLENCIIELEKESPNKLQNTINLGIIDITKTILQKYKSIIGVSDENKTTI